MRPNLIVDGNNLAQYRYFLNGSPVTIEIDREVIAALTVWALRQRKPCQVDLFLDPRQILPQGSAQVFVHIALNGEKADADIKKHVRHCVMTKKACLLVTADDDLAQDASRQGVEVIHTYDFIKFPGYLNLPIRCFSKQNYPYMLIQQSVVTTGSQAGAMRISALEPERVAPKQGRPMREDLVDVHRRTYEDWLRSASQENQPPSVPITVRKAMLKVNLETWPLEDGFLFFSGVLCQQHRLEWLSLQLRPRDASRVDLLSYVQLVMELCGEEEDFFSRGATLIDRIRLELLRVYPGGLELDWIEKQFGDRPGLRHKLDVHSGKSLEFFEVDVIEQPAQD
jgi:hypothetical protein